ncbi:hypothetical protein [Rhabdaerophilum sp. SD176]|uniref:hypothetical protein n=1 Tax=Rhabdaerophilum sp. SD176 TaxID=2983548 RepID=UPI0024DFDE5D|nr:hypothetical protein [Rhabdaerophilum sp. SD176]
MAIVVFTVLAFLAGLVGGWVLSMAAYIIQTSVFGVFDRDGGLAMGYAFTIGPFLGLVLGITFAVMTARRMLRERRARA